MKANLLRLTQMLHRFILYLGLIYTSSIWAEDRQLIQKDEFASSRIVWQTLLPPLINQAVSPLTGEWIETAVDFFVEGPDPLILSRCYSYHAQPSSFACLNTPPSQLLETYQYLGHPLDNHWFFNHFSPLCFYTTSEDNQEYFTPSSGIKANYKPLKIKSLFTENFIPLIPHDLSKLIQHPSSERPHEPYSYLNTFYIDKHQKRGWALSKEGKAKSFVIAAQEKPNYYSLVPEFERKASGNYLMFHPDAATLWMTDTSKQATYNWIKCHYLQEEAALQVKASNGQHALYQFAPLPPLQTKKNECDSTSNYYLYKAAFSHKPTQLYEYNSEQRLACKKAPEGRFLAMNYYQLGENFIEGLSPISIIHPQDPRIGKVKNIKSPVGPNSTPIMTHQFIYDRFSKGDDAALGGQTKVYDAYLRQTIYTYNKQNYLTSVQRFIGRNPYYLYSTEKYVWNDTWSFTDYLYHFLRSLSSPSRTSHTDELKQIFASHHQLSLHLPRLNQLKGKYVQDAHGYISYARFFKYDQHDNMTTDTLYGNLSGHNSIPVEINGLKSPLTNGIEQYSKKFIYSDAYPSLLLAEFEDNGKGILYAYVPHTNLVQSKFLLNYDQVCLRQFYEYDAYTSLTRLIQDDGCSLDKDNLEGVKERHLTYFFPQKTAPIGRPERIDFMYLDLATKQEKLLKRVTYKYSPEGYILKQCLFDSQGTPCYQLEWQYDSHGNITAEKNARGHHIIRYYDANDNLITEKENFTNSQISYEYDCSNRLTHMQHKQANGEILSYSYQYDYMGNCIEQTMPSGQKIYFTYDDLNRLTQMSYAIHNNEEENQSITIHYNPLNHPIFIQETKGESSLTYNARGQPTCIQHADGTAEKFEYHLDGTLSKFIDKEKNSTVYSRDCFGRPLLEEKYSADLKLMAQCIATYQGPHLLSSTDIDGRTTLYTYDEAGRLTLITCNEQKIAFEYDHFSRLIKKTWHHPNKEDYVETYTQ